MSELKTIIDANIKENGNQEITGKILNYVLNEIAKEVEQGGNFNAEGNYPLLHVGTADDLAGRGESVPASFGFRASGGKSIKDGRAYIKRIKGNSVVWNNMVDTRGYEGGIFIRENIKIIKGHKYLLQREQANSGLYLIPVVDGQDKYDMSIQQGKYSGIFESQYTDTNGKVYSEEKCGACIISDLTKMFGAGNEPSTIEEYNARKPIVADEYAYNEGQVIHCNTDSIKSVGDNAWDEQWEVGGFSADGEPASAANRIRSRNYIEVLANEEYYANKYLTIFFYDDEMRFLSYIDMNTSTFITPSGCRYIKFYLYGTEDYNHDILISLYHSGWKAEKDDQYQPYWQDTLPLPIIRKYFPQGMKKAGSAHDEIRFNKATNKWEYSKGRIKSVDLGDLTWETPWYNDNDGWRIFAQLQDKPLGLSNILNKRYANAGVGDGVMSDKSITGNDNSDYIYIKDSSFSAEGVDALIASLQGVMLYYESNDWEWVELDAEDQNFRGYYQVADFGTEMSQSNVPSAPFSADIIYQFNAVDMIREHELEITELQSIIATMQAQLASLTNS